MFTSFVADCCSCFSRAPMFSNTLLGCPTIMYAARKIRTFILSAVPEGDCTVILWRRLQSL
jgi:hypothetical protein